MLGRDRRSAASAVKRDAVFTLGGDGGVRNRGTILETFFFSLFLLDEDGTNALRVS